MAPSPSVTPLDERCRAFGHDLFARIDRRGPTVLTPAWVDDQLMQWTMGQEAIKVQLFRFIDALPNLRRPHDVSRHLVEYFRAAGDNLPPWLKLAVQWAPTDGWAGHLLARSAETNSRRMARRFIAGSNVPEVCASVSKMWKRGLGFTIDLLGEATITEAEAAEYQQQYLELIDGLADAAGDWPYNPVLDRDAFGRIPRVNVSVKLSSLYSQFDPIAPEATSEAVRERLRPILRLARRRGVFVNWDMEQYSFKSLTVRIFKEILSEPEFHDWADVGIAIQAYLRDTPADLAELRHWAAHRGTPVWVRLVKGAYWDYESIVAEQNGWDLPVWRRKWETDACYERMTRFLLENHRDLRPAFGSHNIRSLAHAMAVAEELNLPPRSFEFQTLYGMADPISDALAAMGHRVRVYTPYGQLLPGMAYLVRRLLENTSNESFLRASFTDHTPEEQLLMNPLRHSANGTDSDIQAELKPFVNEPLTDFSQEENRQAMQAGLKVVAGQLGRTYPMVINGERIAGARLMDSVNPSRTRELIGKVPSATADHARQAIRAAKQAFQTWRDVDPRERANVLFRAADLMRQRHFEFAAWITYESAKSWREADVEVGECIDFFDFYAREMLRLAAGERRGIAGEDNHYIYDSRGVAVVIAPWNFPLAIIGGMTAAAIVTGNTAIMKPAEQSPVIAYKLQELFEEAGTPPGVVNYLPGDGEEIGPTLVEHPDVAIIAFTGSQQVGCLINELAAKTPKGQEHVKRVIAEMGGKNATIVDADADLDEAVKGVIDAAFGYSGQKCSACSRAVVHEAVYDTFLNRLIDATKSLKMAPSDDPSCNVGPVIDEDSRKRILHYIEKGKAEAKLVYAGDAGALKEQGTFVAPHVFADVDPRATIAQEEIFGPVLAVIKAKDMDEALDIAVGVPYALTGAVYSRSPDNIALAKRRFRVGNLYINRKCTGAMVYRQPFGGFKLSGIGSKAGGHDYLLQFMVPRTITENTMRRGFAPKEG